MQSQKPGVLYLLPNSLGTLDEQIGWSIDVQSAAKECQTFIVESHKMSRRLLKTLLPGINLDEFEFFVLDKRQDERDYEEMIASLQDGKSIGLISDAGLPAVADPGSQVVALAHRRGYQVRPIVGPSSIMLALMASGMNGQSFEFHGYLTNKKHELKNQLRSLERTAWKSGATQIFIETPYRNAALVSSLLELLGSDIRLCIACELTLPSEWIATRTIAQWKKHKLPDLQKRPCVFLIGS